MKGSVKIYTIIQAIDLDLKGYLKNCVLKGRGNQELAISHQIFPKMLTYFYVGLSILMLFLLGWGYYTSLKKYFSIPEEIKRRMGFFVLFVLIWGVYLFFISKSQLLFDLSFPPKFPLFILFPLALLFVIFYIKNRNSHFIQSIPLHWTTYFQSFRIVVEVILLYTFLDGLIPISATFEGFNFDILMGISAPLVAFFFVQRKFNKRLVHVWNVLGVIMVLLVVVIIGTSLYRPDFWGSNGSMVAPSFLTLPYLLIPGFLAPLAIFIHIVSFCQLRKR